MMRSEQVLHVDVAIIGAGWAGLVAARTYLRLRPDTDLLIIDSDSTVGGVWSKDSLYPNLVAQVRHGLFNYSDTAMPPNAGNNSDQRVTGEMIYSYLQKYAEDHDLLHRTRLNTTVECVEQSQQGWRLTFKNSNDIVEAKKLLVATGTSSIPHMPKFEKGHDSSVPIIHSHDLAVNYELLKNESIQDVVVVGAAKSAYDAVYLLLNMGKNVTWVIRSGGAGPLAIVPSKVLNMLNSIAFASTRLMTHLSPSIMNTQGGMYRFFQKTFFGRWFTGRFWDFLNLVSGIHAGYGAGDQVSMLKPEIESQSVFWASSGLGVVTMPNFWNTLHRASADQKLTIYRDEIQSLEQRTIHLKSSTTTLQTDYAILCTGWGDHFGFFDTTHKAKIGLPVFGEDEYSITDDLETSDGPNWPNYDAAAEKTVSEKLPMLTSSPNLKYPSLLDPRRQNKWRLYRRMIPVEMAEKGDRSIAILGQIHTIQTPIISEVQSFWAILYLLGEVDLPDVDAMATEVSQWNVWTRKRYLLQGQKFCCSYYDFLPYIDSLLNDLGINSRRKSNFISELCSPYHPHDFKGFIEEYLAKRDAAQGKKSV